MSRRPIIGVSMGDPAGIGPEIVLKSLLCAEIFEIARPVVVGSPTIFARVAKSCGIDTEIRAIPDDNLTHAESKPGVVSIVPTDRSALSHLEFGRPQASAAEAAYLAIEKVAKLALHHEIDAVATAPINKDEMRLKYDNFIGHTEAFQELTDASFVLTMFQLAGMRVFFLTRHVALRNIFQYVKKERILDTLMKMSGCLKALGLKNPRIAVAALNPHAGESGLFGNEEIEEIAPAVKEARRGDIDAVGPVPADAAFWLARRGDYDAILSLYHDQGHIATKTVDFLRTVSVTLGLDFIRTSPDHGTAYDIAGKCIADQTSMTESIRTAAEYAFLWRKNWKKDGGSCCGRC